MDPIQDGETKKRRRRGRDGFDSDENENHQEEESSEEEGNLTFMQKLGGFLFFGCGGTSKR